MESSSANSYTRGKQYSLSLASLRYHVSNLPEIDDASLKDAFALQNTNWYNNLSYRENIGNGWKMNLGLAQATALTEALLKAIGNCFIRSKTAR